MYVSVTWSSVSLTRRLKRLIYAVVLLLTKDVKCQAAVAKSSPLSRTPKLFIFRGATLNKCDGAVVHPAVVDTSAQLVDTDRKREWSGIRNFRCAH